MPGLTESQGKIVRSIVQTVPDAGLGQLTGVLSAQMGEHTMADVRDIVMMEMKDRKVRAIVFSPFLSLSRLWPVRGLRRDPHHPQDPW